MRYVTHVKKSNRNRFRFRLEDTRSHLATLRNKREKLKTEIANLARAIAEGHRSAALLDELGKRERELDSISEELLAADGRGLDARLREIEEFVQKRLQDIRGLLLADVPRAKAELSKHCTAITLTPEGSTFRVTGGTGIYRRTLGWCRGPGLYIAVPAHNSRSTWLHEADQTDERPCATLRYGGAGGWNRMVGPSQRFRFRMVITKGLGHSVIPAEEPRDLAGYRKN